jgi:hypothetical protein
MPEPQVLYLVTAAVIAGLVVWVALVLKSAKEPWARAVPAASEGAAGAESAAGTTGGAEPKGSDEPASGEVAEAGEGGDPDETAPDPPDETADADEEPAAAKKG